MLFSRKERAAIIFPNGTRAPPFPTKRNNWDPFKGTVSRKSWRDECMGH
jgi:hypothetical protein